MGLNTGVSQNTFKLRGKDDFIPPQSVKKRFYASPIPEKAETFFSSIYDSKGKNTVKAFYEVRAELHVACENYLCITGALKGMSQTYKLLSKFLRIVKLSVIDDGEGLSCPGSYHGLPSSCQVDDG